MKLVYKNDEAREANARLKRWVGRLETNEAEIVAHSEAAEAEAAMQDDDDAPRGGAPENNVEENAD